MVEHRPNDELHRSCSYCQSRCCVNSTILLPLVAVHRVPGDDLITNDREQQSRHGSGFAWRFSDFHAKLIGPDGVAI